jgi:D-tyrosyl-tRNA(Tyr) deacylase
LPVLHFAFLIAAKKMRAVLQRVTRACVRVEDEVVGHIGAGLLVLLGIAQDDTEQDAKYLADKIAQLRIFDDAEGKMNLSLGETKGALLVVSQFTLYGDVRRGRRPSWIEAAQPAVAEPLYESFVSELRGRVAEVATGSFRRMMQVELVNDGPVTILLDSRKLF